MRDRNRHEHRQDHRGRRARQAGSAARPRQRRIRPRRNRRGHGDVGDRARDRSDDRQRDDVAAGHRLDRAERPPPTRSGWGRSASTPTATTTRTSRAPRGALPRRFVRSSTRSRVWAGRTSSPAPRAPTSAAPSRSRPRRSSTVDRPPTSSPAATAPTRSSAAPATTPRTAATARTSSRRTPSRTEATTSSAAAVPYDTLDYGQRSVGVAVDLDGVADDGQPGAENDNAHADIEIVKGGSGGDTIADNSGVFQTRQLEGGGGNDTITGGPAGDLLYGQDDNDTMHGGPQGDTLYGGPGRRRRVRGRRSSTGSTRTATSVGSRSPAPTAPTRSPAARRPTMSSTTGGPPPWS